MNSPISITLSDLGIIVIWGLVSAILIYIILILARFYKSFKQVMQVMEDNRAHIDKTLAEVPEITHNANVISREMAHGLEAFHGTVDNIAETTESVTGVIKDRGSVVNGITSVIHTASILKSAFDKFFGDHEEEEAFHRESSHHQDPKHDEHPDSTNAE